MDIDPLEYCMNRYGFDRSKIASVVTGEKYTGVMLADGAVGVCANLQEIVDTNIRPDFVPDLGNLPHRIVYNAYLNALLNKPTPDINDIDICDLIDFKGFEKVSMIGFFKPVINRLRSKGIELNIFDLAKKDAALLPMEKLNTTLAHSDAVVLTSTSIFNRTFNKVLNCIPNEASTFLLGPSSIMDRFFCIIRKSENDFWHFLQKKRRTSPPNNRQQWWD